MVFPKGPNKRGETAKQPHQGVPYDKSIIEQLILKHGGNVSRVADAMGAARGSVSDVIQKDPHLLHILKQSRERQLDELEQSCFDRAIETNDTTLQLFLLKTQGKHRGYEQSEAQNTAKDIAQAAFAYIMNQSKNPAEHHTQSPDTSSRPSQ